MTRLYQRKARIIVGPRLFEFPGLRLSFVVKRSFRPELNTAEATVYNLNDSSRGAVMNADRPSFCIEAGHVSNFISLFVGRAIHIETTRGDTIGTATKFMAFDGDQVKNRMSKSFSPGAKVTDLIVEAAKAMKVNAGKAIARAKNGDFDGAVNGFLNGMVMFGEAGDELTKLGKAAGFTWTIQDAELIILKSGEALESSLILAPKTGLIGSPERVNDKFQKKLFLVRGKSILNGRIQPGRRIEIDSVEIKGSFRVESVTHSGDTDGPEWQSEFEAVQIQPQASRPVLESGVA